MDFEIENQVGMEPVKRKMGRPPKVKEGTGEPTIKRKRGRPPKTKTGTGSIKAKPTKKKSTKKIETGTGKDLIVGTGEKKVKKGTGRKKGSKGGYTMSPEALLARRRTNGALPARTEEERAYNAQLIEHIMHIQEIASHADIRDPVSLRSCFVAYVKLCQEDGFTLGNMGAYAAMGIDCHIFGNWINGTREEYRKLAQMVSSVCALSRENRIQENKLNPVIGIFHQRNFDGLRNDTEQIQSIATEQNDMETTENVMEKYGHLIEE